MTDSCSGDIKGSGNNSLEPKPLLAHRLLQFELFFPNSKNSTEKKKVVEIVSTEAAKMNVGIKQQLEASSDISPQMKRAVSNHFDEFIKQLADISKAA